MRERKKEKKKQSTVTRDENRWKGGRGVIGGGVRGKGKLRRGEGRKELGHGENAKG